MDMHQELAPASSGIRRKGEKRPDQHLISDPATRNSRTEDPLRRVSLDEAQAIIAAVFGDGAAATEL